MSYNPRPGADLRVVYDASNSTFVIEQERERTANGTTDENDLGSILDLGQEGWAERYRSDEVGLMLNELFAITYEEEPIIRSIDLGPVPLTSASVVSALERLEQLTY
jgi:hypothetical protein